MDGIMSRSEVRSIKFISQRPRSPTPRRGATDVGEAQKIKKKCQLLRMYFRRNYEVRGEWIAAIAVSILES